MSISAMNWAMQQATGSPSAQCLLYVVADIANAKGIAWPSIGHMARLSQQSPDTVRRRLRELERMGLLVRMPRQDKSGRQTSHEIRLRLDVTVSQPPARDAAEELADEMAEEKAADSENGGKGSLANCEGPLAQVRGSPSQWCKGHNEPPKEPNPPKAPLRASGQAEGHSGAVSPSLGARDGPRLDTFSAAYPIPSTRAAEVALIWDSLNGDEREEAIKAAQGYRAFCEKQDRKPMDAARFLRQRDNWPGFATLAPFEAPEPVFVAEDSAEWRAWAVWRAMSGMPGPRSRDGSQGPGAYFPSAWPPGGEVLAECNPDPEVWPLIEHGSRQWWAWNERWQAWTCKPLEPDVIATGEMQPMQLRGQTIDMPVKVKGRRMPTEWPPPRHGRSHDDEHQTNNHSEAAV